MTPREALAAELKALEELLLEALLAAPSPSGR
jgi:hypothetical protein